MNKKYILIFISVLFAVALFGALRFYHKSRKIVHYHKPHKEVSAVVPTSPTRTRGIVLSGSFVDIATESEGVVEAIHFNPGQLVEAGDVLVELSKKSELLQLEGLKIEEDLAKRAFKRAVIQYKNNAISQAAFELAHAELKKKRLEITQLELTLSHKLVRAPFRGRVDFSAVNIGQLIGPGSKVVRIYALEPVYVDFLLPEEMLPILGVATTDRV
jgi:RND family efflux transporter, MFP subunit